MKFKNQQGQAVLVVLLSLAVVLIVIMFVLSRSITDISLSSKEENSLRAFSAAEAGIERVLVIGSAQSGEFGDATFSADVTSFAQNLPYVVYPISLKSGEIATFWFVGHNDDGTLGCTDESCFTGSLAKFCWGDLGTPGTDAKTPALEITIYYKTLAGEYRVGRKVVDPYTTSSRTSTNGYTAAGTCAIGDDSFQFQNTLNFSDLGISNYDNEGVLQYATAKILYNDTIAHKIGIDVSSSGSNLPSQGLKIESDGSVEGEANRSIEVYQLHPIAPPTFTNAIFSSSGVTK